MKAKFRSSGSNYDNALDSHPSVSKSGIDGQAKKKKKRRSSGSSSSDEGKVTKKQKKTSNDNKSVQLKFVFSVHNARKKELCPLLFKR